MSEEEKEVDKEHGGEDTPSAPAPGSPKAEHAQDEEDANDHESLHEDDIPRTSEDAERIATGKQLEAAEGEIHEGLEEPGHSTTLLPSPMHLDIPAQPTDADAIVESHGPDSPTTTLIEALRTQLTQLHDQSLELNTKLIASISKHADLEDSHIQLQSQHKDLQESHTALADEKRRWEDSMNTGLLVERSQITAEMQKLAAGLVEEERRRGSAEERRIKVENEVDDLAASLFDQANTMVAAERIHRTNAELRLKETEENLAAAESAMRDMQLHLQSLPASANPQIRSPPSSSSNPRKFLASHVPFNEFLLFLSALRALRPLRHTSKDTFPPPLITTLLAQPFIARAMVEDQDPTLRLDAAPDLSYFSRRTVGSAAIAGELIIEPVSVNSLLSSTSTPIYDINCSLCGSAVFSSSTPGQPSSPSGSQFGAPPQHPTHRSSSRFSLKPFFATPSPTALPSTTDSPASPIGSSSQIPSVYVFRVAKPVQASSSAATEKEAKLYPLCKTGWCLERMRATCQLWHFVRTGIIHSVWHGDDGYTLAAERPRESHESAVPEGQGSVDSPATLGEERHMPVVERKKSSWGLGFRLNENSSWRGAFNRSSSSNPSSPGLSQDTVVPTDHTASRPSEDSEKKVAEPEEAGPSTPRPDEDVEKKDIPEIQEQGPSPGGSALSDHKDDADHTTNDEPHTLAGASSSKEELSVSGTSDAGSDDGFHTPTNEREDEEEAKEEETDTKDLADDVKGGDNADKLDDEDKETEAGERGTSPRPKGPRAKPKKSRRHSSRPSTSSILDPSDAGSEAANEEEKSSEHGEQDVEKAETEANDVDLNEKEDEEKEATTEKPEAVISPPRLPPRLPPRHPKQPPPAEKAEVQVDSGGRKRYLDLEDSSWEAKTWKMVVKLKEDMWKARVGVSDDA